MRRRIGWGHILCYLILSTVVIIMLFPLLHIFAIAVSDTSAVMLGNVYFLPHGFSLEAFRRVLSDSRWQASFLFTLFCSVVGMCVSLFVMTGSAYALSRNRCPFRKTILILIAVTLFFSARIVPNYLMIKQLGPVSYTHLSL